MLLDFLTSRTIPCPSCADAVLYDPVTDSFAELWRGDDGPNLHNLYCSGHSILSDGRVLIRGGNTDGPGNARATIYNPLDPNPLTAFIDTGDEQFPFDYRGTTYTNATNRWYPTLTQLGNGDTLIMDGWEKANCPQCEPNNCPNENCGTLPPASGVPAWPDGNPNIPSRFRLSNPGTPSIPLHNGQYCVQNTGGGNYPEWCNEAAQHANLAPPGYYMMFLCTGDNGDLPSTKGEFVRIGP